MSPYVELCAALLFLCLGYWMGRNSAGLPTSATQSPGPPMDVQFLDRMMAGNQDDEDEGIPTL